MTRITALSVMLLPILMGAAQPTLAPPRVAIVGPSDVAIGDLAVLAADSPAAQSCAWVIMPMTPNFRVDSDRRTAYLASGDGTTAAYTVILAVVADGQIAMAQHLVSVGSTPEPTPPTPPEPEPPPLPPEPLGPFSQLVHDWAVDLVPADGRLAESQALAASFRAMAAQIAAGTLKDPRAIVDATYKANRAAVSAHDRWAKWGRKLADQLNAEAAAGSLTTPEQYTRAWRLIAAGLEAVK